MMEIMETVVSTVNIIPTALMMFIMIYWIIVILGVIDVETVDIDMETEVDVEVDAEVELDGLSSVLSFFNIGKMPFMIFVSFLVTPLWFITVALNHYLHNNSFLLSLVFLVPALFVSLFIAKILTTPIARFYIKLKKEDGAVNPVGKTCKVTLTVRGDSIGQAEVKASGTIIRINAIAKKNTTILKGEEALVIEYDKQNKYYLIEPYKL